MSFVDQLKTIFSPRTPQSEQDSRLSLAMPDPSVEPSISALMENRAEAVSDVARANAAAQAGVPSTDQDSMDMVTLPVLGRNTVVQHQKTLLIVLGLSLLALVIVFYFALRQANQVHNN